MTNREAEALFYREINRLAPEYPQLKAWRFGLVRKGASVRLGVCCYRPKTIKLNQDLIANCEESETLDTILHEIAHAIAGHRAGHGWEWKAVCRKIGARPERCAKVDLKIERGCDWVLRHRETGEVLREYARAPRRKSWAGVYWPGRKHETIGKLEVVRKGTPIGSAPAKQEPVRKPLGRWILRHMDTGEIFYRYQNRPRNKNLANNYIPHRKRETLGKLEVVLDGTPLRVAAKIAAQEVAKPRVTTEAPRTTTQLYLF